MAVTLRSKKLGILIRDARITAGKSMKDCGEAIGASGSTISSFEKGKKSPSLPELEMLAHFLKISLDHFWQDEILSDDPPLFEDIHIEHALVLMDRWLGEKLEEARKLKNLSYKDVRENTEITTGRIKKYEAGVNPVPLPELELLCQLYEINIYSLIDLSTKVGQWVISQNNIAKFLELPPEIQEFVCQPVNMPYLDLARRLSGLSTDELRAVAEGLLEITI
jgi:transcriptional regulator with XRE-family HTH domain